MSGGKGIGTNSGLYQNNYQYSISKTSPKQFYDGQPEGYTLHIDEFKYLPKYFHPTEDYHILSVEKHKWKLSDSFKHVSHTDYAF